MKFDVELGDRVREKISTLEGIVMGIHKWRDGTVDVSVTPEGLKEGEPFKSRTFEIKQLEIVAKQVLPAPKMVKPKFDLGAMVVHKLLGFEGYITAQSWWYHGCMKYTIQPTIFADGKLMEAIGCSDSDLDLVKASSNPTPKAAGGPQDRAIRNL